MVYRIGIDQIMNQLDNINNVHVKYKESQTEDNEGSSGEKDAMYKNIAKKIFDLSQKYVPVDSGHLKSTGKIVKNSIGTYSIVYSADYAVYVHEIVENKHEAPTRAKFLEDAAYEVLNEYELGGVNFDFTFSIDTSDELALHLDSISLNDFKFNNDYGDYLLNNFFSSDIEPMRGPESEVTYL